jgi:hypothetical protein
MSIAEAIRAAKTEPDFHWKIAYQLVKTALVIAGEPTSTPSYAARQAYVGRILRDPEGEARRIALGRVTRANVLSAADHGAVTLPVLDTEIQAIFNAYSL